MNDRIMNKKLGQKTRLLLILFGVVFFSCNTNSLQDKDLIVQVAKLEIDSAQLESYRAILKEGIETAIRIEPGVLTLYAVYDEDNPTHVTVFEVYENEEAYNAHIASPHFQKYKTTTKEMVKSLELVPTRPIYLGAK